MIKDWEVCLLLTGFKSPRKSVSLKYSYNMFDCGWKSICRFDALSRQGRVEYFQDVEICSRTACMTGRVLNFPLRLKIKKMFDSRKYPEWKISVQKAGNLKHSRKKEAVGAVETSLPVSKSHHSLFAFTCKTGCAIGEESDNFR